MSGEGVMDMEAREMRMEWTVDGAAGEQTVTQYVVGDTLYMKSFDQWYKQEMPEAVFWESNELNQQADILNASSVDVTGTETYDGHTVKVLAVNPDQEEIKEIMAQGQNQLGEEFEVDEDTSVSDMEITQYVDVESQHVRYTEMRFDMEVRGETTTVEMTMTFDEFDEPVDTSLPEKAEDAGPLPGSGVSS